ncbi:MAG: pseudouridine synthase [Luteimonas sp.]
MNDVAPGIDGISASRLQLRAGPWATVLDALCAQFPAIDRSTWLDRFARRRVLDAWGQPLAADAPYRIGAQIRYYRELADEPRIPFEESVLHADEHLVVADKPHFLPVTPAGGFVVETLLTRLVRRLGNPDLVPLHRIDRGTAGLVLFSAHRTTRAAYQALFRERRIVKRYQALAPPLPSLVFPHTRSTRLVAGEPFFRMREVEGIANSQTRIDVLQREGATWRYALEPVTGKKHQLRVHMAALGAPILNDTFYPDLAVQTPDDYENPLQLLARSVSFVDPVNAKRRSFESRLRL